MSAPSAMKRRPAYSADGEPRSWLRRLRVVTLLAVIVVIAAACGGDDAATVSGDDSGEFAETTVAAFDEEQAEESEAETEAPAAEAEATGQDLAAAGEDDVAPDPGTAAVERDEAGTADEGAVEEADGGQLGTGAATVTQTAADIGRKLIFTANVHVGVDDVAAASAEATSIIEGLGGFVFGQNTVGGAEPSSELVFKVLPEDFNRALEQLGTVGELRNQSVSTDDVTERIVDLESRIQVAELGVERLRAALEGAATLEDYAEIERLLLDRESELEVMRGQLRTLEDRVDLATITLLLTQDRVENAIDVRISTYQGHDTGESCPGQEGFTVEAGSDVTVCFDVVNIGDQTLTDIVITDTVLEIDGDTQLIEVFGSLDELAPGQSALVAHEINPERSLRLRTRVVAVPTDGVNPGPSGPSVSTQVSFDLRTFEPDSDPGFGDGFSAALSLLQGLWIAVTVVIGFLVPLVVLVPFVLLAWWGWRSIRRRRPPAVTAAGPGSPGNGQPPQEPPPPPAVTAGTGTGESESASSD
ncbi:MAG: DUF4349 domain-containing protein [Acidimicrobiia bacterium]|nr:DUF4349 domain-containing protein [Acidimicrobiia bacterium]